MFYTCTYKCIYIRIIAIWRYKLHYLRNKTSVPVFYRRIKYRYGFRYV